MTHLLSVLCVWMKTLSHARAKKKRKQKNLTVSNFEFLLVVSK